jgi:prepilin-type N-terminal cleavage/methylation domain-containing protein
MLNRQYGIRTFQSNGFTLVEIIVTIVIIGIIASISAGIISQGAKVYSTEDSRSNAHYQARLAVERMAREIRMMRSETAADIPTWAANDLRFTDINGNDVRFQLNAGTIRRSSDGGTTWNDLAKNVTALAFTYLQSDGTTAATAQTNIWYVVIDVTDTQNTETLQMRTRVHPMNF